MVIHILPFLLHILGGSGKTQSVHAPPQGKKIRGRF